MIMCVAYCENGLIRVLSSDQTGLRSLRGTPSAITIPVYAWVSGSLFRDTPKMRRLLRIMGLTN